jgi:hypothetical protein
MWKIAQHPATRERDAHVQRVDPPHDRKISSRGRPGQTIDAAAADPHLLRLTWHRQRVRTVDPGYALGNSPASPSAPDRESFTSVNSPILACNVFTSIADSASSLWLSDPKTSRRPFQQLAAPRRDLVRVYVELLRQLCQRLLALQGSRDHLALKAGLCFRRVRFVI